MHTNIGGCLVCEINQKNRNTQTKLASANWGSIQHESNAKIVVYLQIKQVHKIVQIALLFCLMLEDEKICMDITIKQVLV